MIKVNDDYVIEIDAFNYTVKRDLHHKTFKKNPTTGEEIEVEAFTTVGYYSNLTEALKGVINSMNYRALSEGVIELQEALHIVVENNRYLSELLEKALEV